MIDETHDPQRRSWVAGTDLHPDFPIQNLPLGVFRPMGDERFRGGVAIGDQILDLAAALEAGLFSGEAETAAAAAAGPTLNPFMALSPSQRQALRRRVSEVLDADGPDQGRVQALAERLLHPAGDCELALPAAIGGYTDFYAGIHHARNVGALFRPDTPLLPNYKHVPIAYHGRASSIRPSGTAVRRPDGQRRPVGDEAPGFGPSRQLDYELEMAIWIGPGNDLGEPIPIGEAPRHIVGFGLLNDWSARDVQAWEYQPLGPFLAKNFATTVSPWIVTTEALAPFRGPRPARPAGDPPPLPYLDGTQDREGGGLDVELEVLISTRAMRERGLAPQLLSRCRTTDLYWTPAQMVAHHTSGGCDLRPGDLLGTGTISSPRSGDVGSLLELTRGGREPVALPTGETRGFLEDGDQVVFRGRCTAPGAVSIGFGECRAEVIGTP